MYHNIPNTNKSEIYVMTEPKLWVDPKKAKLLRPGLQSLVGMGVKRVGGSEGIRQGI